MHANRIDVQQIKMKLLYIHVSCDQDKNQYHRHLHFPLMVKILGGKKSSFALSTKHNQLVLSILHPPPSNTFINQLTPPIITLQQVLVS